MPFIDQDTLLGQTISGPLDQPKEPQAPEERESTGFLDAVSEYFKLNNTAYNIGKAALAEPVSQEIDPDFEAITTLQQERPDLVDSYVRDFIGINNREQYESKLSRIDSELEIREKLENTGTLTSLAAGLTAELAEPTNFIPLFAASRAVRLGSRALVTGGKTAVAAAGVVALQEAALQGVQETRTLGESATNVVFAAGLGGVLGAGAGALSDPVREAGKQVLGKALKGEDFTFKVDEEAGTVSIERSAGAAETISTELEDLGLAHINERLVKLASGPDAVKPPDLRAALSPSATVRALGEVFYNSNFIRKKNVEGVAANIDRAQNAIFREEQATLKTLKEVDELYFGYLGTQSRLKAQVQQFGGRGDKISYKEYSARIWNGLTNEKYVDELAEVNQSVKLLRAKLDNYAKIMQDLGILDKDIDPKFITSYLTRRYDLTKLATPAGQRKFIEITSRWLMNHHKDGSPRKRPIAIEKAQEIAQNNMDRIRVQSDSQIPLNGVTEQFISIGKFNKSRTFLIPDAEIAEFLDTDAIKLFTAYSSKASKLIHTQRALNSQGHESIQDVIKSIRSEKEIAVRNNPDQAVKLSKQFDEAEELASTMYRSLLGQLRKPTKLDGLLETLLNYQYVRLLGGVTISSFPELVMPVFRFGLGKTLTKGYLPMLRSLKTAKMTKDQLYQVSGALELEMNNVVRAISGLDDIETLGRNRTKWDVFQQATTETFSKATGITYYTSFGRRLSTQIASSNISKTIMKGPKGKEIERLASIGIGKNDYKAIADQLEKHAVKHKGSILINPEDWTDTAARDKFFSALQVEVESTILKPGVESLPFFVQKSLTAKVLFQFKSFMSGATGKVLISGMQRRDAALLQGIIMLTGLGAASQVVTDLIAGREPDLDPGNLILAGLSRSGMLGLLGTTALDTVRNMTDAKASRYAADNFASNILGPSAGQIEDLAQTAQRMTDGDVTDKDLAALGRIIPFNNLFYIKWLFSQMNKDDER